jgi:hypothetical protein
MAGSQSDPTVHSPTDGRVPVRRVGHVCTRVGLLAGIASIAAVVVGVPVLTAGTAAATLGEVVGLLGVPVATLSGVELAVYAGALGLVVACWLLGAGLLIDGLFDGPG